jgi:hypothetical protein
MTGVDANALASLLNMSQRGVYRLLAAYERVYGKLPLRGKRKWVPEGALEVLRRARDMVALGQARSFEAAFRALEGRVPLPRGPGTHLPGAGGDRRSGERNPRDPEPPPAPEGGAGKDSAGGSNS